MGDVAGKLQKGEIFDIDNVNGGREEIGGDDNELKELIFKYAKMYEDSLYSGELSDDGVVMIEERKVDEEKFKTIKKKSEGKVIEIKKSGIFKEGNRITNYVPIPIARIKMLDRYDIVHDLVCVAIITNVLEDKEEIYMMKKKVFTGVGYEQKCCVRSNKELGGKLPKIIEDEYNSCEQYPVNLRYGWNKEEYHATGNKEIGLTVKEAKDVIDKIEWIKGFPKSIAYPLLGFVFLSICKSKIQQEVDISDICLAYQNEQDIYKMVEFFLHISFLHDKSFLRSKGIYKFDYRELGDIAENIYDINNPDAIAMRVSEKLLGKKKQYLDGSLNSYADIEKNILSRLRDIPVLISNTNIKSQMKPLVEAAKCGVIIEYDKVPPKNENMFVLSNEYKAPDDISKNKAEYLNFVKFIIEQFPRKRFEFEGQEMPFEEFWDSIAKVAENKCEQRAKIALLVGLCAVSCIMGEKINEELVKQYINDFSGKADNTLKKPKGYDIARIKEFIKDFVDFYDKNKENKEYFTTPDAEETPKVGWLEGNVVILVKKFEKGEDGKQGDKMEIEEWLSEYMKCNIKYKSIRRTLKENQVIIMESDGDHYDKLKGFLKGKEGYNNRATHIDIDKAREFIG